MNINMKVRTAILCMTIFAVALTGCSIKKEKPEYKRDVFAMDTYMVLKVYDENGEAILESAEAEIKHLEMLFSVTDEKSDISRINGSGSAQVSEDTVKLVSEALVYCEKTDGALDITVYPLLREWGFTTGKYQIPEDKDITALLEGVDYNNVTVEDGTVSIKNGGAMDLGAVAKGYTSDRLCNFLREQGVSSALINLGGNVQAVGTKPDGSPWKVGIEDPEDNSRIVCSLKIEDKAVVTSGNYERYFIGEDGRRYCHIIDPKTGRPADNGLVSVTIVGESGTACDALSTALFVMGKERAAEFLEKHTEIEAVLIDDDLRLYITDGISENVELSSGIESTVIKRQG